MNGNTGQGPEETRSAEPLQDGAYCYATPWSITGYTEVNGSKTYQPTLATIRNPVCSGCRMNVANLETLPLAKRLLR